MKENVAWIRPPGTLPRFMLSSHSSVAIDIPNDIFAGGKQSAEYCRINSRNQGVLRVYYIRETSIPDTPAETESKEPDYDSNKVPVIPLVRSLRVVQL